LVLFIYLSRIWSSLVAISWKSETLQNQDRSNMDYRVLPKPARRPRGLLDLPREVIRNIALHVYDPLVLSQQDRLSRFCDRLRTMRELTCSMGYLLDSGHAPRTTRCPGILDILWPDVSEDTQRSTSDSV
jgi:hypothetical protein